MTALGRDVTVGLRGLRHAPGFALAAILTLTIGIGLATAVFTIANAVLVRELPVRDQNRIVLLWGETPDGRFANFPVDYDGARAFLRDSRTLATGAYFGYEGSSPNATVDGDRIGSRRVAVVSGAFFDVLGARATLGRPIAPRDDEQGAAPVAVLSQAAWERDYGADPSVIGRRVTLHQSGVTYTIVGVMPRGLDVPARTDLWVPNLPSTKPAALPLRSYDLIGRLVPGATPAAARAEIGAQFARSTEPFLRNVRGVVHTLPSVIVGDTRPAIVAFGVAAALLLLLTCVNVANLLLVRGLGRAREIAVRAALGASRGQLARHLLVENGILAVVGGAGGAVIAAVAVRAFVAMAPAGTPRLDEVHLDGAMIAGALVLTVIAMVLFALAPTVTTSRAELQQMLRAGVRETSSRRTRRATEVLVAGQLALALVVLSAAALVGRSLLALQRADLALEPSNLLVGTLALQATRYDTVTRQTDAVESIVERVRALPGVVAVSPTVTVPFAGGWDGRPTAEGQTPEQAALNPMLSMDVVGDQYFEALGIGLVRGRVFAPIDRADTPSVVILSEGAAEHYWPGENPIGKRLRGLDTEKPLTVVGIVRDTRYRALRDARPAIYFPLGQSTFPYAPTNLVVRTASDPAVLVPALRGAVAEAAPGVVLSSAAPFVRYLDGPLAQPRLDSVLLGVFAVAATMLAAVGLAGVMSTTVRQRTREIGVRMAFGATGRDVRWLIVRRGLLIAVSGAAAGLLGAWWANRLVGAMLYEVAPSDPVALAGVTVLLVLVAAAAAAIPARTGARVDPVVALRADG